MNALVIIDLQNDFCPGGALAVPEGDRVVPIANRLQSRFDLVVAAQDWHPANHGSFAANHPGRQPGDVVQLDGLDQILWPVHCVEHTPGAAFHPDFNHARVAKIFQKGTDPKIDSYSAFFDNAGRKATGLGDFLKDQGATDVYLCGLATDYCVKFSALDSLRLGLPTYLIEDACRGVDLQPDDVAGAIHQMQSEGVKIVQSEQLLP